MWLLMRELLLSAFSNELKMWLMWLMIGTCMIRSRQRTGTCRLESPGPLQALLGLLQTCRLI